MTRGVVQSEDGVDACDDEGGEDGRALSEDAKGCNQRKNAVRRRMQDV